MPSSQRNYLIVYRNNNSMWKTEELSISCKSPLNFLRNLSLGSTLGINWLMVASSKRRKLFHQSPPLKDKNRKHKDIFILTTEEQKTKKIWLITWILWIWIYSNKYAYSIIYYYKIEWSTESLQKTWKLLKNRGNYISYESIQKKECSQLNDYPKL